MSDLYCDICGRQPVRAQIMLEGAKMLACGNCMRSGKVMLRFDEEATSASVGPVIFHQSAPSFDKGEDIVEGAGTIIRNAREKLRLPLTVVAEKLNEKESYIHAVEAGRVQPSLELAKKFEKEFQIKLIEVTGGEVTSTMTTKRFGALTLGDLLEKAPEKKKK